MKKEDELFDKLEKNGLLDKLIEASISKNHADFTHKLVNSVKRNITQETVLFLISLIAIVTVIAISLFYKINQQVIIIIMTLIIAFMIIITIFSNFFLNFFTRNKQTIEFKLLANNKLLFDMPSQNIIEETFILSSVFLSRFKQIKELLRFYYGNEEKTIIAIKLEIEYYIKQFPDENFKWLFLVLPKDEKKVITEKNWNDEFKNGIRYFVYKLFYGTINVDIIESFIVKDILHPFGCFIEKQKPIPEVVKAFSIGNIKYVSEFYNDSLTDEMVRKSFDYPEKFFEE